MLALIMLSCYLTHSPNVINLLEITTLAILLTLIRLLILVRHLILAKLLFFIKRIRVKTVNNYDFFDRNLMFYQKCRRSRLNRIIRIGIIL